MTKSHIVQPGECLQSIAAHYGFFPDTLWRHPDNAELARKRSHGSVLAPGDVLQIPERELKEVSAPVDRRAVFRRRAVPSVLRLRLEEEGVEESFTGLPWRLDLPGLPSASGEVDPDGCVAAFIPCEVKSAVLLIDPEGEQERRIELDLGTLAPVDTPEGARARLTNLDYLWLDAPREDEDEEQAGRALRAALRWFQRDHELDTSGELDTATKNALVKAHGY